MSILMIRIYTIGTIMDKWKLLRRKEWAIRDLNL